MSANGRRLGQRREANVAARAIDADGNVTDVTLRDLSPTGARIEIPYGASLPRLFILRVSREKTESRVEVVWRRGYEVGLRFVPDVETEAPKAEAPSSAAPSRPRIEDLRKLARTARG